MPGRHSPPAPTGVIIEDKAKRPNKQGLEDESQRPLASPDEVTQSPPLLQAPVQPPLPPETLSTPVDILPSSSDDTTGEPALAPSEAPASSDIIRINGIEFHHRSEAEFAKLLTYYGIEWQYEPHQFPLQWREGRPVVMFAPDFYLTEYDLYIELTTMRQSLVRRKNRKLRLLRALYPEINIKLLYRRDYERLLKLFGIKPEEIEAEQPESIEAGEE